MREWNTDENPVRLEDGSAILNDVHAFLGRFVAYPSDDARVAHTLWIAHTHLMDAWESTPRIAFLSPEPGSGKTRALEVSELLAPNPVEAVNVSPAYLFRKVAEAAPTLLFDEIDTVFGPRAKENEEIRGLLNAGHRRGAVAGRCVMQGKMAVTEELPAYCAVALAGLGQLPDTILSRSVIVKMRRRAPNETVESFRRRVHASEGHQLRDRLAAWAELAVDDLKRAWPDLPPGIADRDADVWEPLLAIADAAGGHWPEQARVSAVSLVSLLREASPSLGIKLLSDLRSLFGDADALPTTTILDGLHNLEESPWGSLRGKPLDARGLARILAPYDVKPQQVRAGEWTGKGYRREELHDAWQRYLASPRVEPETSETSETSDAMPIQNNAKTSPFAQTDGPYDFHPRA